MKADGFVYLEREGAEVMLDEARDSERHWLVGAMKKPFGRGINSASPKNVGTEQKTKSVDSDSFSCKIRTDTCCGLHKGLGCERKGLWLPISG